MGDAFLGDPTFEELKATCDRAIETGEHEKALAIAIAMNERAEPAHFETLYEIARLTSRLGRKAESDQWLRRAVDAGFWDVDRLRNDDSFQSVRDEERFKAVARRAWVRGYILMLEREERAGFQKPDEVMRTLAFRPGERVADVGAGSGYFTIPVTRAVGPSGVVWAIDIFQEMLDHIEERLAVENIENVRLQKVTREDPMLPAGGVDTILLIDMLHYVQDRGGFARKLRAGLAPGGRVVLVDYTPKPWEERPWGPPPEQQVAREVVDADMKQGGLKPLVEFGFLPEQYFVVYGAA